MSETAAILKFLISPAGLFITISYFFTTGIIALMKPYIISPAESVKVIKNDHFLNNGIPCTDKRPVILVIGKIMSDNSNERKP